MFHSARYQCLPYGKVEIKFMIAGKFHKAVGHSHSGAFVAAVNAACDMGIPYDRKWVQTHKP